MPYVGPSFLLARAVFQDTSGLPRDQVEMSFACHDTNITTVGPSNIANAVKNFFLVNTGAQVNPVADYLSATISRAVGQARVDVYDIGGHLDGSPHGTPVFSLPFTVPGGLAAAELPNQVAVCLAVHADLSGIVERLPGQTIPTEDEAVDEGAPVSHIGTARLRARARGRVFFGPLCLAASTIDTNGEPDSRLIGDLIIAAGGLVTSSAAGFVPWGIWSRRDSLVRSIVGGWVESEFAIQRRRREKPTTRNLWP